MSWKVALKDLKLIQLIAETGSISAAASRMHVSQPAASQRLMNVETQLETELFHRSRGVMEATAVANRMILSANTIHAEIDLMNKEIEALRSNSPKPLRISTQCYTSYRWLPHVLRDLQNLYPEIEFDVIPEAAESPYEFLLSEKIDVALVHNPSSENGIEHQFLFEDELYAVMSESNDLASRSYLNPVQFEGETLLLYTGKKHAIVELVLNPAGVGVGRIIQVRMTEAIVELARAGRGIAVLSGWAYNDLDNRDGLVAIRVTKKGFKRQWQAALSKSCNRELAAAFIKLTQKMGKLIHQEQWREKL